jgi:hypothetical protein
VNAPTKTKLKVTNKAAADIERYGARMSKIQVAYRQDSVRLREASAGLLRTVPDTYDFAGHHTALAGLEATMRQAKTGLAVYEQNVMVMRNTRPSERVIRACDHVIAVNRLLMEDYDGTIHMCEEGQEIIRQRTTAPNSGPTRQSRKPRQPKR